MDQATIIGYTSGYMATILVVLILLLPVLIARGLLLLSVGALQCVLLFLKASAGALYRGATWVGRNVRRRSKTLLDRFHHRAGGRLAPH